MFSVGDLIIYGGEGVCIVEGIGTPEISGINPHRQYYTLKPQYRDGVVYTPVDTAVFMRPVISYEEAQQLIRHIPNIEPNPCENRNLRALSEHYEEFMQSHSCEDLVQLIRTVYVKGVEAAGSKKKLGQIDTRYMNRAEDMLHGELAVVLGIPRSEVAEYISQRIDVDAKGSAQA